MLTSVRTSIAAALLALTATPALADETAPPSDLTVKGSIALVSDYRFRGLSRSGGDIAVQGGVSLSHISGFYAGVWSSSTDYDPAGPIVDARYGSQELDLYGGWTGPLSSAVTADVGLQYYAYPSGRAGKAEFFEPYVSVSSTLGPVTGRLGLNYAWKQEALNFNGGGKDDSLYVYGELSAGIPNTPVSLSGRLGYTEGALSPKYATGRTLDYAGGFDWNLGATYSIMPMLSVTGQYVGVQGRSIDGYSNDTVVATLKFSF